MATIIYEDFSQIRKIHKDDKIVFCSGAFDLTHAGHILFFEECKKLGKILVVEVGNDKTIKKFKNPDRPILNEHIRLKTVSSLRPVDYCVLGKNIKRYPLHSLKLVFKELKPDVYAINEDAFDIPYRKKIAEKFNVTLVILDRWCPPEFNNLSTTGIIEKISGKKSDYKNYSLK